MPSLRQLLATHGTLLVLDAASSCVQAGWLSSETAGDWVSSQDEAAKALFLNVDALLRADPARDIGSVGAFIFCEGPGSILGCRSAATAIRSWAALRPEAPAYRYQSLALLAQALGDAELTLIADARRERWHAQQLGAPLRQVSIAELVASGARYAMPEGFRHWSSPPPNLARVPYDLATLFAAPALREAELFRAAPEPDAFLHNAPSYKTWSPQIHRAPAVQHSTRADASSASAPAIASEKLAPR